MRSNIVFLGLLLCYLEYSPTLTTQNLRSTTHLWRNDKFLYESENECQISYSDDSSAWENVCYNKAERNTMFWIGKVINISLYSAQPTNSRVH